MSAVEKVVPKKLYRIYENSEMIMKMNTKNSDRIPNIGLKLMLETIKVLNSHGGFLKNDELDIKIAENLGLCDEVKNIQSDRAHRSNFRQGCSSARTFLKYGGGGLIENYENIHGFWISTAIGRNGNYSESDMKNIMMDYYSKRSTNSNKTKIQDKMDSKTAYQISTDKFIQNL